MVGPSSAPETSLYNDMARVWSQIDTSNRHVLKRRPCDADIIQFGHKYLSQTKDRGDYQELMSLTLLLLGVSPTGSSPYHVRPIAGVSNARWMGKIINEMKLVLFQNEFIEHGILDEEIMREHEDLVRFLTQFYVRQWLRCPLATEAAVNDLRLFRDLSNVKQSSKDYPFATAMVRKLDSHLWYLSEEMAVFSLFGDGISNAEKAECAKIMKKSKCTVDQTMNQDGKLITPIIKSTTKIWQLFGTKSWTCFYLLGKGITNNSFLSEPVNNWKTNEDYKYIKDIVMNMNVVNDAAERGILLAKQVHGKITHSSSDKQNLLLTIPCVRQKIKKITKSELLSFDI